jgi:hypothetical protein
MYQNKVDDRKTQGQMAERGLGKKTRCSSKEQRNLKVIHPLCALFGFSLKHSLTKLVHVLCKTVF